MVGGQIINFWNSGLNRNLSSNPVEIYPQTQWLKVYFTLFSILQIMLAEGLGLSEKYKEIDGH